MAGETLSRPTIAGFEISTRATPGISASNIIKSKKIQIGCYLKTSSHLVPEIVEFYFQSSYSVSPGMVL
jgi:hypothetical protein